MKECFALAQLPRSKFYHSDLKFCHFIHDNISPHQTFGVGINWRKNMKIGPKFKGGPRTPTLLGIPSPIKSGQLSRDPKDTRGNIRPPVILDQMHKGGARQESYYYDNKKLFSLKLHISCDDPKRVYSIDVMEVNFDEKLPQSATIKFSGNQRLLTNPARLVGDAKLMPKPSVSIVLDPSLEKVVMEIEIEGSSVLPRYLMATIRNRLPVRK